MATGQRQTQIAAVGDPGPDRRGAGGQRPHGPAAPRPGHRRAAWPLRPGRAAWPGPTLSEWFPGTP